MDAALPITVCPLQKKTGREFNKRHCTLLLFQDLCAFVCMCVCVCVPILPRTLTRSGTRLICADGDCYVFMEEREAMGEEGGGVGGLKGAEG